MIVDRDFFGKNIDRCEITIGDCSSHYPLDRTLTIEQKTKVFKFEMAKLKHYSDNR